MFLFVEVNYLAARHFTRWDLTAARRSECRKAAGGNAIGCRWCADGLGANATAPGASCESR